MVLEYVRRWPITDEGRSMSELRAEAIPDLLEALRQHRLSFLPGATTYQVVDGPVPFFQARLVVKPMPGADLTSLEVLADYGAFETWQAQEYLRANQEAA